jgi:hypothetical protein
MSRLLSDAGQRGIQLQRRQHLQAAAAAALLLLLLLVVLRLDGSSRAVAAGAAGSVATRPAATGEAQVPRVV